MAGNPDNLRKAAQRKSQATSRRADLAIREMVKRGEPITFRAVARTARCSIDFVYSNPDIRARIEHLRAQQQGSPPDRAPKTTPTSAAAASSARSPPNSPSSSAATTARSQTCGPRSPQPRARS
jgi:hypothetical protein